MPDAEPSPHGASGSAPRLTVAAVARRLGVAPSTLRTWDRRYGLGPSVHERGQHRRYSADDLAMLEAMRRLTLSGVAPAEAARAARSGQTAQPAVAGERAAAGAADGRGAPTPVAGAPTTMPVAVAEAPAEAALDAEPAPPHAPAEPARAPHRGSGGRVLALPGLGPQARGLARAAMALDGLTCTSILSQAMRERGVARMYEELLRPVLTAVGTRWQSTGQGVEVEHLLSESAAAVLRRGAPTVHTPANRRPVLLACVPNDQHSLPLLVLAASLAERGLACRVLGAALPRDALLAAVRRTGPCVVVLQAQLAATADPALLTDLPALRPPVRWLVAGAGWSPDLLPSAVGYLASLDEAVATVAELAV